MAAHFREDRCHGTSTRWTVFRQKPVELGAFECELYNTMRINVYLLSGLFLLFIPWQQGAAVDVAAVAAAPSAPAAPEAAAAPAAAPAGASPCQPNLNLKALRIVCETADGKATPCSSAPVGSSAKVAWRKHALKNTNSNLELECQPPGAWKVKATKKIEAKADYTVVAGVGAYKIYKDKKHWEDAEVICMKEGAHLVSIDSDQELQEIKKLAVTIGKVEGPYNAIHLGVTDKFIEGVFYTLFGTPYKAPSTLSWVKGKPSKSGSEDCLAMTISSFEMFDIRCTVQVQLPFICEIPQA